MFVKRTQNLPRADKNKFKIYFVEEGIDNSDSPSGPYFSNGRQWIWMGNYNPSNINSTTNKLETPTTITNNISTDNGFGNIWWVKEGTTLTIDEIRENVVSDMVIEGDLVIHGILTLI